MASRLQVLVACLIELVLSLSKLNGETNAKQQAANLASPLHDMNSNFWIFEEILPLCSAVLAEGIEPFAQVAMDDDGGLD